MAADGESRSKLARHLGLQHLLDTAHKNDILLLLVSRLVRMFAFQAIAPILVLYLRSLGFRDQVVGAFLSLTLLGDVVLSLVVTFVADAVGRRRTLALGAALMAMSGVSVQATNGDCWS